MKRFRNALLTVVVGIVSVEVIALLVASMGGRESVQYTLRQTIAKWETMVVVGVVWGVFLRMLFKLRLRHS